MAAPVRRGNLSEEAIRALLEATDPGKLALFSLLLLLRRVLLRLLRWPL